MRTPQVLQIESLKSLGFLVLLRPRLLRATEIDVLAVAVRVGVVPLVSEGDAVIHRLACANGRGARETILGIIKVPSSSGL